MLVPLLRARRAVERASRTARSPMPVITPDGRYLIVKDRLWRTSDPTLPADRRHALVAELMSARRAVQAAVRAQDPGALREARRRVNASKVALGERGPVWWEDEAPDYTRHTVHNTPYAHWFAHHCAGPSGIAE